MKRVLYLALIVLYLLHNDLWYWNDSRLVFGMPIGLLYHVLFCVVTMLLMYGLVRYAWPQGLEVSEDRE